MVGGEGGRSKRPGPPTSSRPGAREVASGSGPSPLSEPSPRECGARYAGRQCVPSPRGLRHLAPLTARAPKPTATSAPHHPPTPPSAEFPNQGRQEASPRSCIPAPASRPPPRLRDAVGRPCPGRPLRRGSGLPGGLHTKEPGRRRGRAAQGRERPGSLRRALPAPRLPGSFLPPRLPAVGHRTKTLNLGLRPLPSSRAWSPGLQACSPANPWLSPPLEFPYGLGPPGGIQCEEPRQI